jgi:hypothetical protein
MDILKRHFDIKDSNGNVIHVELNIGSILPITTINSFIFDNHQVTKKTINNTAPNNTIEDPDMNNRFTFLIEANSFYSGINICIYYDAKYKDYIYMPNPDYYIPANRKNQFLVINGYRVGTAEFTESLRSQLTFSKNNIKPLDLDKPSTINTYNYHVLNLHGIESRHTFRSRFDEGADIYYKETNLVIFAEIPTSKLGNKELPLFDFYITDIQKFQMSYIGYSKPNNVYIPILL